MFDLNPRFRNTQTERNPNHHKNYNYTRSINERAGGVEFRLETMEEDSGVCSPPLWPPDSPVRFPNSRALSPASRARAIARGQREMMEMVESMPETSYELSLKDIVEQRRDYVNSFDETQSMEEGEARLILGGGRRKQDNNNTRRVIVKNGSMKNHNNNNNNKGLFINMFFPFSIGLKKKKKNNSSHFGNTSSHGVKSSEIVDRRDWWKKFTDSGNSDEGLGITSSSSTGRSGSSGSSSSSSSLPNNSRRRENDSTYGCWSLFPFRKKKS